MLLEIPQTLTSNFSAQYMATYVYTEKKYMFTGVLSFLSISVGPL